ncbi:MAG: DUF4231 domain-containing protein [Cyanobacteria bacterium P01_F01_bin.143]
MDDNEYLSDRLEDQIRWYSKKSQYNQKYYKRLRLTEIVSAAVIPFLAGMQDFSYSKLIIGILGVVIAISAAASSLYKFQENWIQYRTTAETLKHEKYLYLTKSPPYDGEAPLKALVERIESLISKENTQWASSTNKSSDEPPEDKP